MRLVTWNVNSLRTRAPAVLGWLTAHRPDVALLQETKCIDDALPTAELAALGYEVAHHGRDHWNGVAILSRCGLDEVRRGFGLAPGPPFDEARYVSARCGGVRVASLYVPNGRELDHPQYRYKLDWLGHLRDELAAERASGAPLLVGGDFNVAPTDADIYDPRRWRGRTHASPLERAAITALLELGLVDLLDRARGGRPAYTWWSYRPGQFEADRGLRIDHLLADHATARRVRDVWVDRAARAAIRPSDHAPVVADLDGSG